MTSDPGTDLLLRTLRRLPQAESDPTRMTRVKARCQGSLDRVRRRALRASRRRQFIHRVAEPMLVGGFGLIYLLAVIRDAFGLG